MSDLTFKELRFRNFMSFGQREQVVNLEKSGTTFIIGENLDDGGSSGAGKSTILNALTYAAFDKIIDNSVSKDKLINNINQSKTIVMSVELKFSVGKDEWHIKRTRGVENTVKLFLNEQDVTPASVAAANAKIEEVIGFSFNLFSQIVLFKGNAEPFLTKSVGEQRALIEELFKITILTKKAEVLKGQLTTADQEIKVQQALIEQQQQHAKQHDELIANAQKRITTWDEQHARNILAAEADYKRVSEVDFASEEQLHQLVSELNEKISAQDAVLVKLQADRQVIASQKSPLITEVALLTAKRLNLEREASPLELTLKLTESKIAEVERSKAPMLTSIMQLQTSLPNLEKEKAAVVSQLAHLQDAKCPFCMQHYADDKAKSKIGELEARSIELTDLIDQSITKLATLDEELKLYDIEKARSLKALEAELVRLVDELVVFNEAKIASIAKLNQELTAMQAEVAKFAANIEAETAKVDQQLAAVKQERAEHKANAQELAGALTYSDYKSHVNAFKMVDTYRDRIEKIKSEQNPHIDALDSLKSQVKTVDTNPLNAAMKLKEHLAFLIKLLTHKDSFIRKGIINKTLPFLNKRIAYYTERLCLPHIVAFQADMSCEITKHGREFSHGNLSDGQKKRLNLALCFAFRDALTYLHSRVNVLCTDEIDGGSLDEQSINAMIGLLKHKAWDDNIAIYIISHRPEFDGRCDRNLVVRLEGGFSTLIPQD